VLEDFAKVLIAELDQANGSQWSTVVTVVDENNQPIEGAKVAIRYYVPRLGSLERGLEAIEGLSDMNGVFVASHKDTSTWVGIFGSKAGFNNARIDHKFVSFDRSGQQNVDTNRNLQI